LRVFIPFDTKSKSYRLSLREAGISEPSIQHHTLPLHIWVLSRVVLNFQGTSEYCLHTATDTSIALRWDVQCCGTDSASATSDATDTPHIAVDETALPELTLGQDRAHSKTSKSPHWGRGGLEMVGLFVFHLWQEIQSHYSSVTAMATPGIPEIGRASFPTGK